MRKGLLVSILASAAIIVSGLPAFASASSFEAQVKKDNAQFLQTVEQNHQSFKRSMKRAGVPKDFINQVEREHRNFETSVMQQGADYSSFVRQQERDFGRQQRLLRQSADRQRGLRNLGLLVLAVLGIYWVFKPRHITDLRADPDESATALPGEEKKALPAEETKSLPAPKE